jgi:hypothetical protein
MGFFSWKTSDTDESISNAESCCGALPVYMYLPDGQVVHEKSYSGYGIFGGIDFYEEVIKPDGTKVKNRREGIDCFFDKENSSFCKFPKFATTNNYKYEDLSPAKECPDQGFFYDLNDDPWM